MITLVDDGSVYPIVFSRVIPSQDKHWGNRIHASWSSQASTTEVVCEQFVEFDQNI
jgi:hypothetical protein